MASIPASQIVNVTPSVLSAGGTALDLNGLILTNSTRSPIGLVPSFPDAASVGAYFGLSSVEATLAAIYFNGFDNSNRKPGALLFAQYPASPVSGYLRGGQVSSLSLAQLQAINGTLSLSVDGALKSSSGVNLSSATSFSNAATTIGAALGVTATYDSVAGAFLVTSPTTGASSSLTVAGGTAAAALKLTTATGAVVSPGAAAGVPGTALDAVVATTVNWATFLTAFEPSTADTVAFTAWNNAQGNRYLYAAWDTDLSPTVTGDTTSAGYLIRQATYSGTAIMFAPNNVAASAAFLAGLVASIDFTETNGRTTAAFRGQSGLTPDVTGAAIAANLESGGYNFYGTYSTANDTFTFLYPGSVSGPFKWIDSYINQIWLKNQLQLALMVLLTQAKSIPYNAAGYALIQAACLDPIQQALNFGAIRAGVTLSQSQAMQANTNAGTKISDVLNTRGWYLQVSDATPQVRAARGSPPVTLWYTDGGSVQRISLASIEIQ